MLIFSISNSINRTIKMMGTGVKRPRKIKVIEPTTKYESVAEVKDEPVPEPVKETVKEKKVRAVRKKKSEPVVLSSDDSPDEESKTEQPKVSKNNKWIDCVKEYRASHPDVSYKDALKLAKEVYVK